MTSLRTSIERLVGGGLLFSGMIAAFVLGPAPIARAQARPDDVVTYTLSPVLDGRSLKAVTVDLRLKADVDGTTVINLPTRWAGQRQLWRNLKNVEVRGGERSATNNPSKITVASAPGADLVVAYQITSPLPGDPTIEDQLPYQPWIRPDWFALSGESTLATVEDRPNLVAHFAWRGPKGFGMASDLEHLPSRPNVQDLQKSTIIGGWRLRVLNNGNLRLAILDQFSFSDLTLLADIGRLLKTERGFWKDAQTDPYLVTVAPVVAPDGTSAITGEGKDDAFSITATHETPLDQVTGLLAHEIFHNWNPPALGGDPPSTGVKQTFKDAWFVEGFTEFYALRMSARSGLFTLGDFVRSWNERLLAYAVSPMRDSPAAALEDNALDPDVEKLPYYQGAMLAAIWDQRLKRQSKGRLDLDRLLRMQRAAAAKSPKLGAVALFRQVADKVGLDIESDLKRVVIDGGEPILPTDVFGACIAVETVRQPAFDRGFDRDATIASNMEARGVRPEGPAAKAGLKEGMKIRRVLSGAPGDSQADYVLEVENGDGVVTTLRYKPEGTGTISVQRLRPVSKFGSACAKPPF